MLIGSSNPAYRPMSEERQGLDDISRQEHARIIQAAGKLPNPFIIDLKKPENGNPDIQAILTEGKKPNDLVYFITPEFINTLTAPLGNEKAEKISKNQYHLLSQSEIDQFMNVLKDKLPELHERFYSNLETDIEDLREFHRKNQAPNDETLKRQAMARWVEYLCDKDYYSIGRHPGKVETYDLNDPRAAHADCRLIQIDAGDGQPAITKAVRYFPEILIAKLPADDFSIKQYNDENLFINGGQSKIKDAPGPDRDWRLFFTFHEAEHSKGHENLSEYYKQIAEFSNLPHNKIEGQLREIEADLSALHALDGIIDPSIKHYWCARRLAIDFDHQFSVWGHPSNFEHEFNPLNGSPTHPLVSPNRHSTGFFIHEYINTGQLPDYVSINHAQNSFYRKTVFDYYQQAAEVFLEQRPDANLEKLLDPKNEELRKEFFSSIPNPPPLDIILDSIRRSMNKTPEIYTPREMDMANTFITRMQEDLGIKPRNLEAGVKESLDAFRSLTPQDQEAKMGGELLENIKDSQTVSAPNTSATQPVPAP